MRVIEKIASWWRRLWDVDTAKPLAEELPITFGQVTVDAKTPGDEEIGAGQFHVVVHKGEPYWALFKCPCGCGNVVSLPLRQPHRPRWRWSVDRAGRPSLTPSVWRTSGCHSHFWIEQGRVLWCGNTGRAPYEARPDLYAQKRM